MSNKSAKIIPLRKLKRDLDFFDYGIPAELSADLKVGQLVEIEIKRSKIPGLVYKLSKNIPQELVAKNIKLKPINSIITPLPLIKPWQMKLIDFISENYFVSKTVVVKMFVPDLPKRETKNDHGVNFVYEKLDLNKELKEKIDTIKDLSKPVILRYFDPINKFKAYKRIIDNNIAENKQTLIIVPELIYVDKALAYLGEYQDQISLFLNTLAKGKYYKEWSKINQNEAKVIIGTRSAITAPTDKIGTVIIDDEDNENHKQEEPNPRYSAKEVALELSEYKKCQIVLSSMAPTIDSLYKVHQKEYDYLELDKPQDIPEVKIIDRNDEFKKGNFNILSEDLFKRLSVLTAQKRQVFLFLNRKGSATLIKCDDCQYTANCDKCNLPMTLHSSNKLVCHHCGLGKDNFLRCPSCGGSNIKAKGIGTESLFKELQNYFNHLNILDINKDAEFTDDQIESADIIVGTKYSLPYINWSKVGLIGVVSADSMFYLPDYRSIEKTFGLLLKLVVKAANEKKEIIIQTFSPENKIFDDLKKFSLKDFYSSEIKNRKEFDYPPFTQFIKIIYQNNEMVSGENQVNLKYLELSKIINLNEIQINPPALAYVPQVRNSYRWNMILKIKYPEADLSFLKKLEEKYLIDVNPESLL